MNQRQALELCIGELTGRLTSLSDAQKAELDKFKAELMMLEARDLMLEAKEAMVKAKEAMVKAEVAMVKAEDAMVKAEDAMVKAEDAMVKAEDAMLDSPNDPAKSDRFAKAEHSFGLAQQHYYEMCRLWGALATPVQQAAATAVGWQGNNI